MILSGILTDRRAIAVSVAALLVALCSLLWSGPAVRAQGGSGVSAALAQCTTAVDQSGRSATFSGQMMAIESAQRMAMRIDVQERTPGEIAFHTINAPGLGVWRSSEAGVKIYKYLKQITNLSAPGEFRGLVGFRWLAGKGHLIRQTARHTQPCQQPDERPKLVVARVAVLPTSEAASASYRIVVRNEGRGPAPAFGVALSIAGASQPPLSAGALPAGGSIMLQASGPRCQPGGMIEVNLDPEHQLEEAPGGGQTDELQCPSSGPSG
ncbi:MAG TPA: hypothetical protein VID48_10435 [Solirubrobacteraceae bacterium]|jgi:hypothetical protein